AKFRLSIYESSLCAPSEPSTLRRGEDSFWKGGANEVSELEGKPFYKKVSLQIIFFQTSQSAQRPCWPRPFFAHLHALLWQLLAYCMRPKFHRQVFRPFFGLSWL